jgi:hypothetical protein
VRLTNTLFSIVSLIKFKESERNRGERGRGERDREEKELTIDSSHDPFVWYSNAEETQFTIQIPEAGIACRFYHDNVRADFCFYFNQRFIAR